MDAQEFEHILNKSLFVSVFLTSGRGCSRVKIPLGAVFHPSAAKAPKRVVNSPPPAVSSTFHDPDVNPAEAAEPAGTCGQLKTSAQGFVLAQM